MIELVYHGNRPGGAPSAASGPSGQSAPSAPKEG